jgi:tRNA-dihydrouridine synthase B
MKFPKYKSPVFLSPMAGVSDVAFRELCKKYGAGVTYTEFVSSAGLVRGTESVLKMTQVSDLEKPVGVQLFGNNIEEIINSAKILEDKFDIIDINCGCPAWKVIKTGAGSELLKSPEKIADFVKNLSDSVSRPVTVKIRLGIDEKNINVFEVAQLVEKAGASAITIHGRTQKQGYSGSADWEIIKKVKSRVKIPVIGNGDVFSPEDFKKRFEESKVDAIMIARGAIGNPYLFKQINDYLKTGSYKKKDKIEQFFEYLELAKKYNLSFKQIKFQAINFTKSVKNGAELRKNLSKCSSLSEIENFLKQ